MDKKRKNEIKNRIIKKGVGFIKRHPGTVVLGVTAVLNKFENTYEAERQRWSEEHSGIAHKYDKVEAICDIHIPNQTVIRKGSVLTVAGYNDNFTEYIFDLLVETYDDGLAGMGYLGPLGSILPSGEYKKQYYPVHYFKIISEDATEDNS